MQGNILVVDDIVDNLRILSELLTQRGHRVRAVRDGRSALISVQAQTPDLILLDIRLPGLDGYEICRQLKRQPATAQTPVIFLSALNQPQDRIRGFEAGGDDYINKPFEQEEVIARVENKLLHAQFINQQRALSLAAERQRIARELHDSVQQTLFVLGASVQSMRQKSKLPTETLDGLRRIYELSQYAVAELRLMLFELRPEKLIAADVGALLQQLVDSNRSRSTADIRLITDPMPVRLPPEAHLAVYRIAQEALHNAITHADANEIQIVLRQVGPKYELQVADNGRGFNMDAPQSQGNGLENMRARAAEQALEFAIESCPDQGTAVRIQWKASA